MNNTLKTTGLALLFTLLVASSCSEDGTDKQPRQPSSGTNERVVGVWPISGTSQPDELASTYGPRLLSGNYDFHRGFDVAIPTGTPVHAILAGTVVRVEEGQPGTSLERFGKFIAIAHEGVVGAAQHQTVYLHLNEFSVSEGDLVEKGEVIGQSGKTGVGINTEHLHFEYHIGTNDGKQNRLNTRSPLRILPYEQQEYVVISEKNNEVLTLQITQDDASTDLIAIKFLPQGFSEKVLDFETREGVNAEDEDTNPYQGLTISPSRFVTSSETYQLKLDLLGDWGNLSTLSVEMKDVRDSTRKVDFDF